MAINVSLMQFFNEVTRNTTRSHHVRIRAYAQRKTRPKQQGNRRENAQQTHVVLKCRLLLNRRRCA